MWLELRRDGGGKNRSKYNISICRTDRHRVNPSKTLTKYGMQIPNAIVTLLAGILLTIISLWYGQNHGLMPVAASEEATHIDNLFNAMMTIATGLFIIVQGTIVYSVIKFRRAKGDTSDGLPIEGNVPLEIVWTAIPAVIAIWLSVYSFEMYNEMGGFDPDAAGETHAMHHMPRHTATAAPMATAAMAPSEAPKIALGVGASPGKEGMKADVTVNVMGLQYAWIFTYPDLGITSGELHVPVGKEVQLNITAQDVLHAVWIPQLRLKQDAIPGTPTELRFTANRVGSYPLRCAELCGGYHGSMVTRTIVHTPEEYTAWIDSQKQVASKPATQPASDGEYLTPYANEMGITKNAIASLHQH
jgi:cytochrome c oxidase subunit II